jgi:hypothetical protein
MFPSKQPPPLFQITYDLRRRDVKPAQSQYQRADGDFRFTAPPQDPYPGVSIALDPPRTDLDPSRRPNCSELPLYVGSKRNQLFAGHALRPSFAQPGNEFRKPRT